MGAAGAMAPLYRSPPGRRPEPSRSRLRIAAPGTVAGCDNKRLTPIHPSMSSPFITETVLDVRHWTDEREWFALFLARA